MGTENGAPSKSPPDATTQWPSPDGLPALVADRVLDRAANLEQLAQTQMQWRTRVPVAARKTQAALAQADPPAMVALQGGDRAHAVTATYADADPCWGVIASEPPRRMPSVDQPWRQQSDQAVNAWRQ